MSDKQAKKIRKEIKSLLKQKTMDNKPQVQFSLKQLETFVELYVFLTGKKPDKIELVPAYYNYYIQEVQYQAEAMGLNVGFKDDKPTFLGVVLEKKPEIVVPNN